MSLEIRTLGAFGVRRDGTLLPDPAWKTQKNRSLLKILITHRGHALTKDQLIDWLWPEHDPAAAQRDLRVAVSQLRALLQPDQPRGAPDSYIITTEAGYAWNIQAPYQLDADEFERRARVTDAPDDAALAALNAALALYGGDYLEEDRYADWAIAERERLREIYFGLLLRLAEANARRGRYGAAIGFCRQVLAADRCRESVWQQLLIYYFHAGERALALRAYEECRATLAAELGVEPLPLTAALAAQIRAGSLRDTDAALNRPAYPPKEDIDRLRALPVSLGRLAFVGRSAELLWLLAQQHSAVAGRLVLVEGEAGVGKTRLAEEALAAAQAAGTTILRADCREEEQGSAYAPILRLVHTARELRPQLFAPGAGGAAAQIVAWLEAGGAYEPAQAGGARTPEQRRARLHGALTRLFLALPQAGKQLCLFFDDLQWADSSTLDYLDYLDARQERPAPLLLATFRSEEAGVEGGGLAQLLWSLRRRGPLARLKLERLGEADVAGIVRQAGALGADAGALARRLYAETEGSPLFLVSLLEALFDDGLLRADEAGRWQVVAAAADDAAPASLPPTVAASILRRVERLGQAERQVLEAAAVLGSGFDWQVLYRLRSWRRDLLLDYLESLRERLLIGETGDGQYAFSHDKIRQAVYDSIPAEQRAWLHRRAGEALEVARAASLDQLAATLAFHFEQGAVRDKAFDYHRRAGERAARLYALDEAATHFRAALVQPDGDFAPPAAALAQTHERLGDSVMAAGKYAAADEQFAAAQAVTSGVAPRVRLLHKLAHTHSRRGQLGVAIELLAQAVALIDAVGPEAVGDLPAASIYARWAILNSGTHGKSGAEHYARLALGIIEERRPDLLHAGAALSWEDYDLLHGALINVGDALRHWGDWDEAKRPLELALVLAERQHDPASFGYSQHNLGDVLLGQGDFAAARASYLAAATSFAGAGQLWEAMAAHMQYALAWACVGDWEEARAGFARACVAGERIEPTDTLAEAYLWLALAQFRCGAAPLTIADNVQRARAVAAATGAALSTVYDLVRATIARDSGAIDTVLALLATDQARAFYMPHLLAHLQSNRRSGE